MDQIGHVLIVEDNPADAQLARGEVESHFPGAKVHIVQSLQSALAAIGQQPFDIILLDLSLPDCTGLAAIDRICATSSTPVVILTERANDEMAMAAMCRGVDAYLLKGAGDRRGLAWAMRYAVYRGHAERQIRQLNADLEHKVQVRTAELERSRQQLQHVVDSAPVIMWAVDMDSVFTMAAGRLDQLGLASEQMVGQTLEMIIGDRPDIVAHVSQAKAGSHVAAVTEFCGMTLDTRYSPLMDDGGKITGVICVATDITQQRRMEQELIEATQCEQRRLGRDLHDGIQGNLVGISLMLNALDENLRRDGAVPASLARDVQAIEHATRDALVQTRALARGLCPADLRSAGLGRAFAMLAQNTSSVFGIGCEFKCGAGAGVDDELTATQLYYIGLEALNNAVKHSGARRIEISLSRDDGMLTLAVLDDGVGISAENCTMTSMGLRIMAYRAKMIGATLEVGPGPKSGTVARCRLPMRSESRGSGAVNSPGREPGDQDPI